VSDEEPTQIPVDAPAPDAAERVDIVSPEPEEQASEPAFTPPAAATEAVDEHPEIMVAGAFAGAFLFAKFLQRIGR
jgi:hypothetical protein